MVHALEVAYFGISLQEAVENIAQLLLKLVLRLLVLDVRVRSHDIFLELRKVWVRIQHGLAILQHMIVARVRLHLAESSSCFQPDQSVHFALAFHDFG